MQTGFFKQLQRDLEAPIEVRRLGTASLPFCSP